MVSASADGKDDRRLKRRQYDNFYTPDSNDASRAGTARVQVTLVGGWVVGDRY